MDIQSIEELFKLVRPSLLVKSEELKRKGYNYINEKDIFNYLVENNWKNAKKLELYQIVSDILNADEVLIDGYLKKQIGIKNRNIYFE